MTATIPQNEKTVSKEREFKNEAILNLIIYNFFDLGTPDLKTKKRN